MNKLRYRPVRLHPLRFQLGCAWGLVLISTSSLAQIISDKAAPASQQPVVLAAPNGTLLVHIQTPSPAGVSRNTYSQFDVPTKGTILHNSRTDVQSQLGGWVPANPLLAGGTARVILNEVNAIQPSQLQGFVEVAGSRAQVVIANPAGIHCSGCGFINASRATLTTGVPVMNGGDLESYRVQRGSITVGGAGLFAKSTDYTDLIARSVQINSALWAKHLKVTAGSNQVNAAHSQIDPIERLGPVPTMGIDVGYLGGMYAGKIQLVGSEHGVGVRNAGEIGASAGEVMITVQGRIENAGRITSAGNARLLARHSIDNSGTIYAQGTASLSTPGQLNNSGVVVADIWGGGIRIDSDSLSGDGQLLSLADLSIQLKADYHHTGTLHANGNANLQTKGVIFNDSSLSAGGQLFLKGAQIYNGVDGKIEATRVRLHASNPHALINRGLIDGQDTFIESATVKNFGTGRIYGDHIAIAASQFINASENGKAPVIAARKRLDLAASTINNKDHAILFSAGDMAIGATLDSEGYATGQATVLNNDSATIEALGTLDLAALAIRNTNQKLVTEIKPVSTQRITEYAGAGSSQRYLEGTPDVYVFNDESDHLHTPEGRFETWWRYSYQRSLSESTVVQSDPAHILSGDKMRITADTLVNDNSRIIAGGDLIGKIGSLKNNAATGTRTMKDVGTVTNFWRDHKSGLDKTGSASRDYAPAETIQTISLNTVQYEGNTTPVSSGVRAEERLHRLANGDTVVRGGDAIGTLAHNSLFHRAPDPAAHYLIETDPAFANYRQWLSSDYLLRALAVDPALTQKRLGDGFYEQRLVREQVAQLTGRRFLEGYANEEAQYQGLMNRAASFAETHALRPGIALTAAQVAELTSDIIWLIEQTVTLPSGDTARVLVPQLYVRVREGDLQNNGALIAGNQITLDLKGDLINGGSIAERRVVSLNADNVRNLGGQIRGAEVSVEAQRDLENIGGSISADRSLILTAGRDLTVASTLASTTTAPFTQANPTQGSRTYRDRVAGLYVTGSEGTLLAVAGNDLTLAGAEIFNKPTASDGSDIADSGTSLVAGRHLSLGTVTETSDTQVRWNKDNYRRETTQTDLGSVLQTQGDLQLHAGQDLTTQGASLSSEQGGILLSAERDIRLGTASSSRGVDEAQKHTSQTGLFSSKTITTRDKINDTVAQATTLSGEAVILQAVRDITLTGSHAVSTLATGLAAGRNVILEAADNTRDESRTRQEKSSGLLGTGGLGFTIGTRTQDLQQQTTRHTAAASTVGSTLGDIAIEAAQDYRQTGSHVLAPEGGVDIAAQRVDIQEARNTQDSSTLTRFKQTGVSVALSSPVIAAVQTAQQMTTAAGNVKDPRLKVLAAANVAMAANTAYEAVKAGQGTTINGKDKQIKTGTDADGNTTSRDSTAADKLGGFTVSVSIGSNRSSSQTINASSTAAESTVNAGTDVQIAALGAGVDSSMRLQGARVKAGQAVILQADNALALLAAQNTDEQHSKNQSSSASLGVALSSAGGVGFIASGSVGRGHADGLDRTASNTHIEADQIALLSGGDTRLQGAVAKAEQVAAYVGGNLHIESLQDSTQFDSRQKNSGAGIMIGSSVSGNASFSRSHINSDYASVVEQSGIRAGDGGFNLQVGGNTSLQGGAITSTQTAVEQDLNTLNSQGAISTTNLDNHAQYKASAIGINVGTGINPAGKLAPGGSSVGLGRDSQSQASITQAAISGIAGNQAARTGDKETGTAPLFDASTVQKNIDAQVQITQMFGQQASKAIGDYANNRLKEANNLRSQAATTTDDNRSQRLLQQAAELESRWGDTGGGRLLAHIAAGGLTAGVNGAAGAATSTLTAPYIADQLATTGADDGLAKVITAVASTTAGAIVGGASGASTAFNEVTNNYLSHVEANRYAALQLKKMRSQCDAACESEIKALAATDKLRDTQLATCDGIQTSACTAIRQDVRNAAAGYIRANQPAPSFEEYGQQREKTKQLAQESMTGVRFATLDGYGQAVVDGVKLAASGLVTGLRALIGDPQARNQVAEGAQKAYAYVSDPENLPYLLGAMTPETREQLAKAYELGDGKEVGRILGEQFASLPIPVAGVGSVKKISKVVDVAEDTEKLSVRIKTSPVDVEHAIGGDYNFRTGRVTGGHSLLKDDVRVVEYLSLPDSTGVYLARVEIKTPDGRWVEKANSEGKPMANTMFPKDWDETKLKEEIHSAWSSRNEINDGSGRWTGTSRSGVKMEGYLSPRTTAYPLLSRKFHK